MFRKFYLVNGNGTTQTMTDPNIKVFADDPSGLGFSKSTSYLRVGDANLVTYEQAQMTTKSFTLRFYENSIDKMYKQYYDFVKFLTVKPIYLLYEIMGKTYRMEANVDSLTKTQISKDNGMLNCSFSMTPLTFWEDNISNVIETSKKVDSGKAYELQRPYYYGSVTTDNITINSIGTMETPLQITIEGDVTDPQYNLFDENGEKYGTGKFTGTYDYVYVNSADENESIILKQNETVVTNPYNAQDLTIGNPDKVYVTFLKLKPGINKLAFLLDAGFDGTVKIEWRNRYISV